MTYKRTYRRNHYDEMVRKNKGLADRREQYARQKAQRQYRQVPMDTSNIHRWTPEQWAEFESRFAPPSWRSKTTTNERSL